jgi:DNA-binding transcriptional LysR family regulator
MAKGGGTHRRGRDAGARHAPKSPAARRPATPNGKTPNGKTSTSKGTKPPVKGARTPAPVVFDAPADDVGAAASLRLGLIPGATPGKWIDAWHERLPDVPIALTQLEVTTQRDALLAGDLDLALVRLPIDREGLSVIPLYDEIAVVVCAADSALTAADELDLADLDGEVVIVPRDAVYDLAVPGAAAPAFAPPADTAEAVATAAAGVGVVIVPLSLARLHHRKDAAHRPLRGAPVSSVALAWPSDRTTPEVEAFVGIVRGRTANSSRS